MSEVVGGGRRSAKGLIFRSLLQRRTLTLLQIQPLRSATTHHKGTHFLLCRWSMGRAKGLKDLKTSKIEGSEGLKSLEASFFVYLTFTRVNG
ncbi:UNVERIFIED_CONTAM: hypothetical protein ABIC26_001963 [Paenibacillus sp. PvR008]